jgi:hypothetical protein
LPDDPWKNWASDRYQELLNRGNRRRVGPLRMTRGAIHAVCMEPTFESILLICESIVRRLFGVRDSRRIGWPSWDITGERPENVIQDSIMSAKKIRPVPKVFRIVYGDMKTAKNDWGERILREMLNDPECLEQLREHPTSRRLREVFRD